jgi:TorA maturation chaperone TorD
MFGEPHFRVRELYRTCGLASAAAQEPDDHLALELAFMARLCALSVAEPERITELLFLQRQFLSEHLVEWVPSWADDVSKNARTRFWRGLAALTQAWLKEELSELEEMLPSDLRADSGSGRRPDA